MALSAYRDSGKETVDWWFIYKLPHGVNPVQGAPASAKKSTGWEYLYYDPAVEGSLALSEKTLDQENGALHNTLQQIYNPDLDSSGSLGWICYNDEIPQSENNDGRKGHSKGILAFDLDSDTAFWLLHSWPKFPDTKTGKLASWDYGHTYLCVSLQSVETARYIVEQMYHRQEPQTYECVIPKSLKTDDIFYRVANAIDVNETDPPCDITFFSSGGQDFRLLAKNRHWNRDFWIDHVGPHLKTDIDVETWRRGAVPSIEDSDGTHHTADILNINLEELGIPYEWHYTKDHAKWAISESEDWVCVADINRQKSQEKRGGGTICFRNQVLHDSLAKIERLK